MMNAMRIKPLVLGVALGAILTVPVHAGLKEALDGMLMSNVTNPGAYHSQTRGGFVMGSIVARSPIRQVNLVAFDPPRINAGCGGIDLFGGSFSFINADQLVALFRSIATNAVGALFYMAIQKIQPDLANLMSKFQSLVHALNLGNKNTCAIANSLVQTMFDPSSVTTKAANEKGMLDSVTSAASDLFGAVTDIFTSKGETKPDATSGGSPVESATYGNLTWKALVRTHNSVKFGEMFGNSTTDRLRTLEIVQSILGTQIIRDGSGSDKKGETITKMPTIPSARMFVEGLKEGEVATLIGCPSGAENDEQKCNNPVTKTITQSDWKGVRGLVNDIMFGDVTGNTIRPNSLVYKVVNCSSSAIGPTACGFTAQQKAFVEQIKIPVIYYLRRSQGNPSMAYSISQSLAPLVVNELAINYLDSIVKVMMQAWNHAGEVQMPLLVADSMKSLREELAAAVTDQQEKMARLKQADDIVALMVKNNPNIIANGGR